MKLDGLTERVRPRKKAERPIVGLQLKNLVDRADVVGEVAMGELHAFRGARRARRIDEIGNRIGTWISQLRGKSKCVIIAVTALQ